MTATEWDPPVNNVDHFWMSCTPSFTTCPTKWLESFRIGEGRVTKCTTTLGMAPFRNFMMRIFNIEEIGQDLAVIAWTNIAIKCCPLWVRMNDSDKIALGIEIKATDLEASHGECHLALFILARV